MRLVFSHDIFHDILDREVVLPGGILVPQTFGVMASWNPHVHAIVANACRDREGNVFPMPEISTADIQGIEKLFTRLVFKMLQAGIYDTVVGQLPVLPRFDRCIFDRKYIY